MFVVGMVVVYIITINWRLLILALTHPSMLVEGPMKITIDIDVERQELESIVGMLLNGPLTEADIAKAEQREILREQAECKERVSAIFHKSIDDQRKKALCKAKSKSHS